MESRGLAVCHAISREFCKHVGWLKPDGGLKDMMAKVTQVPRFPRRAMVFGPDTEPSLFPPPTTLDEVRPLSLHTVVRYTREGKRCNEFIAPYHYLGYKTVVGAQMRYAVTPPSSSIPDTFVETPRFTGALYKASGWIRVGITRGRGRYDGHTGATSR